MIFSARLFPALAVFAAGCVIVDAWRKHHQARAAKADLIEKLTTWEGEGGNLPPSGHSATAQEPETSLATSAP